MNKTCENCKFQEFGICKRYPPTVVSTTTYMGGDEYRYETESIQPDVVGDDWCGEFKQRKET